MEDKFSLCHLAKKLTSRKLWIWIISTLLIHFKGNGDNLLVRTIVWGVITVFYYCGDSMDVAFTNMVSKGNLNIGLGAQANMNYQGALPSAKSTKIEEKLQ